MKICRYYDDIKKTEYVYNFVTAFEQYQADQLKGEICKK